MGWDSFHFINRGLIIFNISYNQNLLIKISKEMNILTLMWLNLTILLTPNRTTLRFC